MPRIAALVLAGLAYSSPAVARILVYSDTAGPNLARDAAVGLGYDTVVATSPANFDQLYIGSRWELVMVELSQPAIDPQVVSTISTIILFQDPLVLSWAGLASNATMRTNLQVNVLITLSTPVVQYTAPTAQWDFFKSIGGQLGGATNANEPDVAFLSPTGGGYAEADNGAGGSNTIVVTRNGLVVTNSFAVLDYQGDADGDSVLDMVEVYQEEIDYSILDELTLSASGTCPGPMTLSVVNNSPQRLIAFAQADFTGFAVLPKGSCTGLVIDLAKPVEYLGAWRADNRGRFSMVRTMTVDDCGDALQIFDAYTCELSDVVFIP